MTPTVSPTRRITVVPESCSFSVLAPVTVGGGVGGAAVEVMVLAGVAVAVPVGRISPGGVDRSAAGFTEVGAAHEAAANNATIRPHRLCAMLLRRYRARDGSRITCADIDT